jgi:hypothetical protein
MYRSFLIAGLTLLLSAAAADSAAAQGVDPYQAARCEQAFKYRDYAGALEICHPLAAAGLPEAQYILGVMLQNGHGVVRNPSDAAQWYTNAAKQGHTEAQFNLGSMYRDGSGVWQDYVEAYAWLDVAAASGHADAASARGLVVRNLSPSRLADAKQRSASLSQSIQSAQAPSSTAEAAPDAAAEGAPGAAPEDDARVQEIVDRLRAIVIQAERERSADVTLLQDLRNLVNDYYWPWRVALLDDDFRDGDFTVDPEWAVANGDFRVEPRVGLRSRFTPPAPPAASAPQPKAREQDLATRLFGAIMTEVTRDSQTNEPEAPQPSLPTQAEIHTTLDITNAFAITVEMTSLGAAASNGAIQFGPYQGFQRETGYRIEYKSGPQPVLQLLRVFPDASSVIEIANLESGFEGGQPHTIEWRRDLEGGMAVLVDGNEVMRTTDRALRERFNGFTLINLGGDYGFRRVAVSGAPE